MPIRVLYQHVVLHEGTRGMPVADALGKPYYSGGSLIMKEWSGP